ncbi:type I secretion system permease/ATPase [Roseateles sp. BYS180W]|uniref:Type I secretion system permease/ATPase n=1 Tax=Roseateles rivi TaxID=3299028 RepID=A0ABW7FZG1_9BURK
MTRRHDDFFEGSASAPPGSAGLRLAAQNGQIADPALAQASAEATADAPPPGDPLLACLAWLTQHHGRGRSAQSLRAGAPLEAGPISPQQGVQLMREAGYNAGLLRKGLHEINDMLLPAVLLLNGGDACVLQRRVNDAGQARFEVVFPGPEAAACLASPAELDGEYSGYLLAATPRAQPQARGANDPSALLAQDGEHWLWGTLKRFTPYYRSAMLAALISNVLMLVSGLVTSIIYDKVIPHQALVTLWTLAVAAVLALVFDLFARQLRAHLIDLAGRKADLIISAKLFRQTLGVRMEHKPASAGAYAHYLAQVEIVRDFFTSATMSVLTDLPFVVLFVAMTFMVGGQLGWVLVLAIPLILGLSVLIQGQLRRATHMQLAETADLHGTLVEVLEGLEDVKTSGAEGRFVRRYERASAMAAEAGLRSRHYASWSNNVAMTMQQLINLVMLVWGVYLIQDGLLTAGGLLGAVMFAGRATMPLSGIVGLATRYQAARAAMRSLDQAMNAPNERDTQRAYVPLQQFSGRIGLNDVGFAYPAAAGQQSPKVLKGVNLRIQGGERLAILGRIGSGKSTVLRLLAGLYQPTEGMVEVEGIDLRQIDPAEYRASVGFVSQEPRLFQGTLRDNVLMGRHVDAQRLVEVAQLTGLDRVVAQHPMGWDLPVGEMGGLLSGGQRQLVALARALVDKPQVLLMDEPTSSMDAQSEMAFLRQLKDAASQCTLVVVTHRPAVLELVRRIVVVDSGKLVMDGPRDQVLAALSGVRPAQAAAPATPTDSAADVHMHPATQPVQRSASV